MKDILRKTHVKENINILKARDFFFDKARNRNKWYEFTIAIPPIIASLTYVPNVIEFLPFVEESRDFIVGICTIVFVIIGEFIVWKNGKDLKVSNALREEYDLEVFGLPRNEFAYEDTILKNRDGTWKRKIADAWESRPDTDKYEVWYQEVFTDDNMANILCLQMDNIIYTFHVYKGYKKRLKINMYIGFMAFLLLFLMSVFLWNKFQIFLLIMFSLFGALQSQLSDYKTVNELIEANSHIYEYIIGNSESIKEKLSDKNSGLVFLRSLQDIVLGNRERGLFIPKRIREKYLKNGKENGFYVQLDNVKNIYMQNPVIPDCAEEIEVFSGITKEVTATLDAIHARLLSMLSDVNKTFKESGVRYMLDRGSLIGACRDEKGFVFWDDDVDISLMISDVEKAKKVIREKLGDKYDVQDYYSDEFYSPRLSNFRIREKNNRSIIEEKDSELYEAYENRGIFIDVCAFSPIVVSKFIDSMIRRILFQGLNFQFPKVSYSSEDNSKKKLRILESENYNYNSRIFQGIYARIRKEEKKWKYDGKNRAHHQEVFQKLKAKYMKRVTLYQKMAHNTKHFSYIPNHIDNLYKPGPYIKSEALNSSIECLFEDLMVQIPADANEVLTATYDNWKKSPFLSLSNMIVKGGCEFSKKKHDATSLKHIKYINKF